MRITRLADEIIIRLFSVKKPFTEHFFKWEDDLLPDKYDHNYFEYSGQPSREEYQKALEYQRSRNDSFIKLQGDHPLEDSFGLEEGVTLTMVLQRDPRDWKRNDKVHFATPTIEELEEIEVKHFAPLYGESFTRRNIHRLYEKLDYHGAYIDDALAGSCYSFSTDDMICVDGLVVDGAFRGQYVATSLLAFIAENAGSRTLFLHADEDDTPKEMYLRMGFVITDRMYEYSCTELEALITVKTTDFP